MYLSPYRDDTKPSLKVDYNQNLWYDYGTDEGGSIIDLVMKIEKCSFTQAIQKLNKNSTGEESFSFHRKTISESTNSIQVDKVKQLENKALIQYLEERKIDIEIAKQFCKEVYYTVNNKRYFAIGFENRSGGYELRNKYFKGCIGKKDISFLKNNSSRLLIFEGFMDFISLISMQSFMNDDIIILNSVANTKKVYHLLDCYPQTLLYLDNDDAGDRYTQELIQHANRGISDLRQNYKNNKDLNEYLTRL